MISLQIDLEKWDKQMEGNFKHMMVWVMQVESR